MNFPMILFLQFVFSRPFWSTGESRGCLFDAWFEKMRFSGSLRGRKLFNTTWKMYKTFMSIYLTTGSRVKTAKEINSIFKIKDGDGLLRSKLSAEIPHWTFMKGILSQWSILDKT